ncbi:hypothetical protein CLV78_102372 [Aliiruegeria haliotis]|uniref:Uncharacterized protein n=1 Tax=Aliiruegeria haliotis TaxID=1280846 RepID=A0A2T0RVH5_9RHOB|nr:hypothetical protein CLV78_102372 [Aliiruegeria haliotis]
MPENTVKVCEMHTECHFAFERSGISTYFFGGTEK